MKHCNTCSTDKPKNEFHTRKASKDGLSPKCRSRWPPYDDTRLKDPKRIKMREEYARTEKGIERGNSCKYAWSEKNQKKKKASTAVGNAVRDGKMAKKPCEICGATYRIHAHHDDYDKVYDVRWLCSEHHREWHKIHGEALNSK